MERRKFFKTSTKGVLAASMLPIVGELTAQSKNTETVASLIGIQRQTDNNFI